MGTGIRSRLPVTVNSMCRLSSSYQERYGIGSGHQKQSQMDAYVVRDSQTENLSVAHLNISMSICDCLVGVAVWSAVV